MQPKNDSCEQELFLDALECQSARDLDSLISERCGGNDELRQRILELLRLHDSTSRILDDTLFCISK